MSRAKVELIPWDPNSPDHFTRLVDQRIKCGWASEQVPQWQDYQRSGFKCIYWLVLSPDDPDREARLAKLVSEYPKEKDPITDTADSIRATPRTPTEALFHPVGHISLDVDSPAAACLNLPIPKDHVYWIKTLYVSFALQSSGIARAAMDLIESMATSEPLCAKTLMLDTVSKEDQLRKESIVVAQGKLPPTPTQAWYERRGYKLIHTENNFYGFPEKDQDGNPVIRRTVFLRRDLV
ncbi:hypothetical protein CORC01_02245 [Colletotrichum orchidophilum]|uniref:N-acetyltransferase domain-containing protein n=1 Tax=Colletotrichum orchidophilum TaxID=1209926 RepID=A0A1G4BM58_9PEZI|nr:uncharacterized protein CORC01_02245 [Colletotrichum orchidophilum]OHF02550.1 hypothetical protein CORC01_02245 [Colletotrichum orchidophilum]